MSKLVITVTTLVNAPVDRVWQCWTSPEHVVRWNHASDDWHTPSATNDLRPGGRFVYRMEARDGSFGFDFSGTFQEVIPVSRLVFTLDDDRRVEIQFQSEGTKTKVIESFEAETQNSPELQEQGWGMILENFRKYTESLI